MIDRERGGLDNLAAVVGSNLSALERSASRDAKYIDRTAHCKAIAPLTGLALSLLFISVYLRQIIIINHFICLFITRKTFNTKGPKSYQRTKFEILSVVLI